MKQHSNGGGMALVGVTKAAAMTGKSRATIYRKMKTGELSYTKGNENEVLLDTSELMRVFGTLQRHDAAHATSKEAPQDSIDMQLLRAENARLQTELQAERAQKDLLRENVQDLRRAMLLLEHKEHGEAAGETVEKKSKKGKRKLLK